MEKKIKVGLIGCGGMGNVHLRGYAEMDNVEVVALCDIIPEKLESYAQRFNVTKTFTDYQDLIALEELDAIDITTPNYLHSIIAEKALLAGKHVFSEKPDAVSVEEALKMKNAAEQSGKTLMVMRNNRYNPNSRYLKKYIAEGKMGDIYAGRCGWQRRRGIPGMGGWFTTKAQSGGGPLIDLGVHMIDLSIWLMGNPTPVTVSGCTYNKFAGTKVSDSIHSSFGEAKEGGTFDVEDLAMGFIKFDNGACLQIEFSWASNVEAEKTFVELRGTKAGSNWENGCLKIFSEDEGVLFDTAPKLKSAGNEHKLNLVHFIDVISGKAEPDFVPQQGLDMIKILTAIYQSAQTGREVVL